MLQHVCSFIICKRYGTMRNFSKLWWLTTTKFLSSFSIFFPLIALITLEQDSYQRFLYGEILPKWKKKRKKKGIVCHNILCFSEKISKFWKKLNGFLKKIHHIWTSDSCFNFLMLCHWLASSHEGFNIKWQQVFRTCLNSFLKLIFKCYQTKINVQMWWFFFTFLFSKIWNFFQKKGILLQNNPFWY